MRRLADFTHDLVEEMNARQALLREHGVEKLSELRRSIVNGTITGITLDEVPKRLLFLFDEGGAAFTPTKDPAVKAIQDEARTNMETLGMLGRAMEVNIVMTAQKPTSDNIGTTLRDQMDHRVLYAGSSSVQAAMSALNVGEKEAVQIVATVNESPRGSGRGYLHRAITGIPSGLFQSLFMSASDLTAALD